MWLLFFGLFLVGGGISLSTVYNKNAPNRASRKETRAINKDNKARAKKLKKFEAIHNLEPEKTAKENKDLGPEKAENKSKDASKGISRNKNDEVVEQEDNEIAKNKNDDNNDIDKILKKDHEDKVNTMKNMLINYQKYLLSSGWVTKQKYTSFDFSIQSLNNALKGDPDDVDLQKASDLFDIYENFVEDSRIKYDPRLKFPNTDLAQKTYNKLYKKQNQKDKSAPEFTSYDEIIMNLASSFIYSKLQQPLITDLNIPKTNRTKPINSVETSTIENIDIIRKNVNSTIDSINRYKFAVMDNPNSKQYRFYDVNNLIIYLNKINEKSLTKNQISSIANLSAKYNNYDIKNISDRAMAIQDLKADDNIDNKRKRQLDLENTLINAFIYEKTGVIAKTDRIVRGKSKVNDANTISLFCLNNGQFKQNKTAAGFNKKIYPPTTTTVKSKTSVTTIISRASKPQSVKLITRTNERSAEEHLRATIAEVAKKQAQATEEKEKLVSFLNKENKNKKTRQK